MEPVQAVVISPEEQPERLAVLRRDNGQKFLVLQQICKLVLGNRTRSTVSKFKTVLRLHFKQEFEFATLRELAVLKHEHVISEHAGRCMLINLADALLVLKYFLTTTSKDRRFVLAEQQLEFVITAWEGWLKQPPVVQAIVVKDQMRAAQDAFVDQVWND